MIGGDALGGGVYNAAPVGAAVPVFNMTPCKVTGNAADGGAGQGIGGGIYNLGSFVVDASLIQGNTASTSDDDVFGILTPL